MNSWSVDLGPALTSLRPADALWQEWLSEKVTTQFKGLLQAEPAPGKPWPSGLEVILWGEVEREVSDPRDRVLIQDNIRALSQGHARAVITGQQPGFAGGPLYTLFKIASTIELAATLCAHGQAAVPVFWMGDDDDDAAEALSSRAYLPISGEMVSPLFKPEKSAGRNAMVGTWKTAELEGAWRSTATDVETTFAESFRRYLREAFPGSGLVIVRGNESALHAGAASFYQMVLPQLNSLRELARQGRALAVRKFDVAPLAENSLQRPLYEVQNEHRRPLATDPEAVDPGQVRPGVMLRALVQDWFFDPAAVVVGPGELSYLTQLMPLYQALNIPRSPLLPRLFGGILPADMKLSEYGEAAAPAALNARKAEELANQAAEPSRGALTQILQEMGHNHEKAESLSEARSRRWIKGVRSMLQDESQRLKATQRDSYPAWIFPGGGRQERTLAWAPLLAAWGRPFLEAVITAARQHWTIGAHADWQEFLIRVPSTPPSQTEGTL